MKSSVTFTKPGGGTDPDATAAGLALLHAADAAAQAELLSETVLVKSANGTLWKLTASNDGTPSLVEQL